MTELASLLGGVIIGVALVLWWVRSQIKPNWDKHAALAIYCAFIRSGLEPTKVTKHDAFWDSREFTRIGIEEMKGDSDGNIS